MSHIGHLRRYTIIGAFLALATAVAGLCGSCTRLEKTKETDRPVIGVILPFSSAFTSIAEEQKNAIEMALEESGYEACLMFKDGGSDSAMAIAAFNELASMETPPVAVITCASWVATSLNPIAAGRDIFHIAIGSAAFNRVVPKHTVRFTIDDKVEERQLAGYLSRFKRIAIMNMDNGYGNNWAKAIRNGFGDRVVASVPYDPKAENFSKPLSTVKAAKPDALVLLSAGNAARIAKQAHELGIGAQLVGTRPIQRPELLESARYTNGLVYTYPSYDTRHPMVAAYRKAHGAEPTIFASEAYDALQTLLHAFADGNRTPALLFEWYAGRTYTGALGEVQFDNEGDASYPYLLKQIVNGQFRVAPFQFPLLLEQARKAIDASFDRMDETLADAAGKLGKIGLKGDDATRTLLELHRANAHVFDCVAIDAAGVIVNVAPEKYADVVGKDISDQEQVRRLQTTRKPVMSQAIDAVEGFVGFDIEHPVFGKSGEFLGAVSVLTEPGFFGKVIAPRVANFPVEMWMMQKDGRIVYDVNETEIGENLFTSKIYADYPSLREVGRRMVAEPEGSGEYTFLDKKLDKRVHKRLLWTTVTRHGTEIRLALAYVDSRIE